MRNGKNEKRKKNSKKGNMVSRAVTGIVVDIATSLAKDAMLYTGRVALEGCKHSTTFSAESSMYDVISKWFVNNVPNAATRLSSPNMQQEDFVNSKNHINLSNMAKLGYIEKPLTFVHNGWIFWYIHETNRDRFDTINIWTFGPKSKLTALINHIFEHYDEIEDIIVGAVIVPTSTRGLNIVPMSKTKRRLDSVFIESSTKATLVNVIKTFETNKDWYTILGIPYRLGILLEGCPGSGKTSLVRALAYKMGYTLIVTTASSLSKSLTMCHVGEAKKAMLLIEDIDCSSHVASRDDGMRPGVGDGGEDTGEILSNILNSLDGIGSYTDCILVMTTNHVENLDPALIRPGRIDMRVEIGCMSHDTIVECLQSYYPDSDIAFNMYQYSDNITGAQMQNYKVKGLTAAEVMDIIAMKYPNLSKYDGKYHIDHNGII